MKLEPVFFFLLRPFVLVNILLLTLLVGCTSLPIEQMPSKSYNHRVQFLVMHFTAIDYQRSVNALVKGPYVSSHYLIPERFDDSYPDDELKVLQLVDEQHRAWHAGSSYWQGRNDLNDQSIGIEIVNVPECEREMGHHFSDPFNGNEHGDGRLCIFPDYDPEQIALLVKLSKAILERHPDIGPTQVVGHSDITPSRKNDPGPRFPWYQLYKEGIGAWYDNETVNHYWQQFTKAPPSLGLVQAALRTYGYGIEETGRMDAQTLDTLSAFQMHFLPWHVSGEASDKTAATLFALIDKYFPERLTSLMERYNKEQIAEPEAEFAEPLGQVDSLFPEPEPSERKLVNDRKAFKAYAGEGEIIIDSQDAEFAEIYVNGEQLNIQQPFAPDAQYRYSLARRTRDGTNHLRVENVQPEGASVRVRIPYPVLQPSEGEKYDFSALDSLINSEIEQGYPGAVLLVVKDGQVIKHSAYGYKRLYDDNGGLLPKPQAMSKDTLFDMASNTKMFATNFALMKLMTEGKLSFNDKVSRHIPEFKGQGRAAIRVKDLLTHTAGYGPEVRFFERDNKFGEAFFSQNKARTVELLLHEVPLEIGRGIKPVYSDTGFLLLGVLVERLTNMSLDQYVESQIYEPLGLHNTKFNPLRKGFVKSQFAATEIRGNSRGGRVSFDNIRDYVLQGEVHDEKAYYAMQGVAGHAGLFSDASDMAVLTQVLLNRGGYGEQQVFAPSVLDQFSKASDMDITLGLGWRRAGNGERRWHFGPYASPQAIGHTGWTGTVTVVDPEYDLAIVLLTNRRHTPVVDLEEDLYGFKGDEFELGRYGSIISLIYEAVLSR
ncbi:penicillin binding protein PBP4B [Lacimicrobium alkaliphilum]|uniref:N-acetylmuramoyl-L-alanine amidase n=1 Tax=Lacimicrobium alkaliphilum TaxID=1526571 RepID=A0A0U2Z875_9ALTE|nr:penicillin binding protein PBP4B [Lacimicrobium alkaliphilum]ALS99123.1 N-acetylmuramoyl-L-alanine amidase [Lacimicrobium alkaliphilum]